MLVIYGFLGSYQELPGGEALCRQATQSDQPIFWVF